MNSVKWSKLAFVAIIRLHLLHTRAMTKKRRKKDFIFVDCYMRFHTLLYFDSKHSFCVWSAHMEKCQRPTDKSTIFANALFCSFGHTVNYSTNIGPIEMHRTNHLWVNHLFDLNNSYVNRIICVRQRCEWLAFLFYMCTFYSHLTRTYKYVYAFVRMSDKVHSAHSAAQMQSDFSGMSNVQTDRRQLNGKKSVNMHTCIPRPVSITGHIFTIKCYGSGACKIYDCVKCVNECSATIKWQNAVYLFRFCFTIRCDTCQTAIIVLMCIRNCKREIEWPERNVKN